MKTINKILFLLATIGLLTANTFAATLDKIEAINNNTVEITASNDVVFSDIKVDWEVKLLKDIPVSFSAKDTQNPKKVLLNLSSDITANTSYSLITVLWGEWNIDFKIAEFLQWEFVNSNLMEWEHGIEKVNIVDSRTIEVYYNVDLTQDTFEYKILSELETSGLKSSWNNVLNLSVAKNLEKSTNYILMVISLKDATGKPLNLTEDLYDLLTPADLMEVVAEEPVVVATTEPDPIEVQVESNTWNVVEVAKTVETTPETGAATNVLLMIAFLLSLGLIFRKKFAK